MRLTFVNSSSRISLAHLAPKKRTKAISTYSKMQLFIEFRVAAERAADQYGGIRHTLPKHVGLNMMWQGRSHSAFFARGFLQLAEKKVYQLSKRWLLKKPNYSEIAITPLLQITCFSRKKHLQYEYLLRKPVRVIREVKLGGHPHAWAALPNVARYKNGNDLAIRVELDDSDGRTYGAWLAVMQLTWHQNNGKTTPLHLDVAETMMSLLEVGVEHAIREVRLVEGDPKIPDWKWVPEPIDVVVYETVCISTGKATIISATQSKSDASFEITLKMCNEMPFPCVNDDRNLDQDKGGLPNRIGKSRITADSGDRVEKSL
jgi:hypothetical protein